MTFVKYLRSVARAANQRLGIMRKPGKYFMIDRSSCDIFGVLFCRSCTADNPHIKLLDRVVESVSFFGWRCVIVQPCSSMICNSVVMLFKWSKPMHFPTTSFTVCTRPCNSWCFGCSSASVCASSLQNFSLP